MNLTTITDQHPTIFQSFFFASAQMHGQQNFLSLSRSFAHFISAMTSAPSVSKALAHANTVLSISTAHSISNCSVQFATLYLSDSIDLKAGTRGVYPYSLYSRAKPRITIEKTIVFRIVVIMVDQLIINNSLLRVPSIYIQRDEYIGTYGTYQHILAYRAYMGYIGYMTYMGCMGYMGYMTYMGYMGYIGYIGYMTYMGCMGYMTYMGYMGYMRYMRYMGYMGYMDIWEYLNTLYHMLTNSQTLAQQHITVLSFCQSGEFCAVGTKRDTSVRLYRIGNLTALDSWVLLQTLKEHTQTISSMDWSGDEKLVTASHDRSVIVWRKHPSEAHWEKMLVNLYSTLAILTVKWAPSGTKFGLGSSCCALALGHYSQESESWTVVLKKDQCKSSIVTLSFHPSSNVLAVGSTDCTVKVFTCNLAVSSKGQTDTKSNYKGLFENINSAFELLYSCEVGAWVNHVSFEEAGRTLLVVPHGGPLRLFSVQDKLILQQTSSVKWNGLPFLNAFLDQQGNILLGGYDRKVASFVKKGNRFEFQGYLERNESSNKEKAKKGIVSQTAFGIERKDSIFNQLKMPGLSEHMNYIQIVNYKRVIVSYDINGVIHFWE